MTTLKEWTLDLRWQVVEGGGAHFIRELVNDADAVEFGPLPAGVTPQAMVRKYLRLLREAAQQIEAALHVSQHAVLALSDDPSGPPLIE